MAQKLWFSRLILWASAHTACKCRRCKRHRFDPWVRKIPWRRAWQRTPGFLPGKPHGQRSLMGYNLWGRNASGTALRLSTPNGPKHLYAAWVFPLWLTFAEDKPYSEVWSSLLRLPAPVRGKLMTQLRPAQNLHLCLETTCVASIWRARR